MEAVIFDMDGVLIDSEPLHHESDLTMLSRFGIEVPEQYFDRFVGMTNPAMWREILDEFGIERELQEVLNAQLSLKLKLLKKSTLGPIDGVHELLKELYLQDIPVAVASSSSGIFIKEALARIKVQRYVSLWVSGESVEKGKPEPDVFLKAAELLGVSPDQCVVVEDSRNGILAAKRAGMKCVGFKNPNSGNQDVSQADAVVDSMKDVTVETLIGVLRGDKGHSGK
jgi:HAD superfamily hydrolase (TIGR01509 family)